MKAKESSLTQGRSDIFEEDKNISSTFKNLERKTTSGASTEVL